MLLKITHTSNLTTSNAITILITTTSITILITTTATTSSPQALSSSPPSLLLSTPPSPSILPSSPPLLSIYTTTNYPPSLWWLHCTEWISTVGVCSSLPLFSLAVSQELLLWCLIRADPLGAPSANSGLIIVHSSVTQRLFPFRFIPAINQISVHFPCL